MTPTRRKLATLLTLSALVGCGLDIAGLGEIGDGNADGGDTPGLDASIDTSLDTSLPGDAGGGSDVVTEAAASDASDAAVACTPGVGTCVTVPATWTLVAFETTTDAGCPPSLAPATDVMEGPTAGAGTCVCGACTVTTAPTCTGKVDVAYDVDGTHTCLLPGVPNQNANNPAGGCDTDLFLGAEPNNIEAKLTPSPPDGGVCSSPGVLQKGNIAFAGKDRVCAPANPAALGCVGSACAPSLPVPFRACVAHTGDQNCPPGNFSVKHLVGTDVTATCGACGCGIAGTCAGNYTLYTDPNCMVNPAVLTANGTCGRNAAIDGQSYKSYRYVLSPTGVSCAASGAAPAPSNVALVNTETVCCPP